MAKSQKPKSTGNADRPLPPAKGRLSLWIPGGVIIAALIVGASITAFREGNRKDESPNAPPRPAASVTNSTPAVNSTGTVLAAPALLRAPPPLSTETRVTVTNIPTLEVNKAVMVTVELDFGTNVPTIAAGLREVERRYQPDDGKGRTFAILDAYGEPTPGGKLHMSMHISSEKPGMASLIFKRTGEVLWQNRVVPSSNDTRTFTGKELLILVDNGQGKFWTIDGSSNPLSVLDAKLKEVGQPLRDVWPDGEVREMTFIYSACGCPVKVLTQRVGDRTVRTKEMPVIFPDDPAVVDVISRLMRWTG